MSPLVVVHKVAGTWWLGRGLEEVPGEVGVDAVVAALTGAGPASRFFGRRSVAPGRVAVEVLDDDCLLPAGRVGGIVTAEGVLVEDHRGRPVLLGEDLLRALDCIDHQVTAAEVLPYVAERLGTSVETARGLVEELVACDVVARTCETVPPAVAVRSAYAGTTDGSTGPDEEPPAAARRVGPAGRVLARLTDAYRLSSRLAPLRRLLGGGPSTTPPRRVPVVAPWHPDSGPLLALGMLTAAARHHDDGRLNDTYAIGVPTAAAEVLDTLRDHAGPAVLLCSDYVWSLDDNLELARAARAACPGLVVVHGGPSAPKYEADAAAFLDTHRDAADVVVRGEGEATLVDLLERLAPTWPDADLSVLADCPGLTYRDPATGLAVRTPDRDRIADLDTLPSPYLTGEFDHIDAAAWKMTLSVETNRGCPYGCTFCDWGSATMSRIRKFDLDRVTAELEWAGQRQATTIFMADANFGIWSRDVEVARAVADVRRRTGYPKLLAYTPAKNTTKHLAAIMDVLMEAGVGPEAAIGIQSSDPTTLDAIDRNNISNDHFVALAAEFRRRGLPLQGELMLGLPGQSVESYMDDLQFLVDLELTVRTWALQVLPNAPMNDPEYRARHGIEVDDHDVVTATATATVEDRVRMIRVRNATTVSDRFGLLRHVLRYLQWDHGHRALDVVARLVDLADERPEDYPVLTWTLRNYDLQPAPPGGFGRFYDEVRRFVVDELGVPDSTALDTVLDLQQFLMPTTGRTFPATVTLAHDYLAYYRSATDDLYRDGRAHGPAAPLDTYGPAEFTVEGDPLGLCSNGLQIDGDSRNERLPGDFVLGANSANELQSPLMRYLPWVAANGIPPVLPDDLGEGPDREDPVPEPPEPVAVRLGPR